MGELDGVERLGERADLVDLDEDRVADALLDPAPEEVDVRHEEIVADELHAVAEPVGQRLPAVPVVLAEPVLDRDDREAVAEVGPEVDHPGGVERAALALQPVGAVVVKLARRRVERERDPVAMAGALGGLEDHLAGVVADRGRVRSRPRRRRPSRALARRGCPSGGGRSRRRSAAPRRRSRRRRGRA